MSARQIETRQVVVATPVQAVRFSDEDGPLTKPTATTAAASAAHNGQVSQAFQHPLQVAIIGPDGKTYIWRTTADKEAWDQMSKVDGLSLDNILQLLESRGLSLAHFDRLHMREYLCAAGLAFMYLFCCLSLFMVPISMALVDAFSGEIEISFRNVWSLIVLVTSAAMICIIRQPYARRVKLTEALRLDIEAWNICLPECLEFRIEPQFSCSILGMDLHHALFVRSVPFFFGRVIQEDGHEDSP